MGTSASTDASRQDLIGLRSSTALIIANMVGTGVFTSLGYQLLGLSSPVAIVALWLVGGLVALCGAAVYGELGVVFAGSGGEYNFLSRLYHPLAGFLAGWLSSTVGFAAPIALAALAFGAYCSRIVPGVDPKLAAAISILVLGLVHARGLQRGTRMQNMLTLVGVGLMLLFVLAGLGAPAASRPGWTLDRGSLGEVCSAPFAVSMVYVYMAFSGWNASTYVAGEIRDPKRNLPLSMLLGTGVVMALYLALNISFLRTAPMEELRGVLEVGHVSASHVFGKAGARIMSLIICVTLLGSVSGMILTGSRVPCAMAQRYRFLPFLQRQNRAGAPSGAVLLQAALALLLVLTGSFEAILTLIGFALSLCTCLSVAGVFLVRARRLHLRSPYRCWGYPLTPVLFLALNLWMLAFLLWHKPLASGLGLLLIASGVPAFHWLRRRLPEAETTIAA